MVGLIQSNWNEDIEAFSNNIPPFANNSNSRGYNPLHQPDVVVKNSNQKIKSMNVGK